MEDKTHVREASTPDSDSEGADSNRKRSSRSSRTVSNLSKDQLLRKRANDREAQRAIRKRTKEQLSTMTDWIQRLTAPGQPGEQMLDLLRENDGLRREKAELVDANKTMKRRLDELDPGAYASQTSASSSGAWEGSTLRRGSLIPNAATSTREVAEAPVQQDFRRWSTTTPLNPGQVKLEANPPQEFGEWGQDPARFSRLETPYQRLEHSYPTQAAPSALPQPDQYGRVYSAQQYGTNPQGYAVSSGNQYLSQPQLPRPASHTSAQQSHQRSDDQIYYTAYSSTSME